ncbi:MAG: adenylate/guanylate cyclase domain-containing protein [Spirochaetales bacterium]|nr:adenylate/guanylate cyclase domain-containing protein [Spirochaetales bacterium]
MRTVLRPIILATTAIAALTLASCADEPGPGAFDLGKGWTLERGQGVESVDLPASIELGESKRFSLARQLPPEALRSGDTLYIELGRSQVPFRATVNGIPIAAYGEPDPKGYWAQAEATPVLEIPTVLLRLDGTDLLILACRYEGDAAPFPAVHAVDVTRAEFVRKLVRPLNTTLYVFMTAASLFAALVMLVQWAVLREPGYILFALASTAFAVFFAEFGFPAIWIPYHALRGAAKAALPLAALFTLLFAGRSYSKHKRLRSGWAWGPVLAASAVWIAVSAGDDVKLDAALSLAVVPSLAAFLHAGVISVLAWRRRTPGAATVSVGLLAGLACSIWDGVWYLSGMKPIVWLAGPGLFALDLGVFLALGRLSLKSKGDLEESRVEIEDRTRKLQSLNEAFSRFVPSEFIELLGRDGVDEVELGDQALAEMAVLVADIRDFTGLSEEMGADDVFRFLNGFYGRIVPAVRAQGGLVDKFMGDALMAIFPGGSADALAAAQDIRRIVVRYNEERKGWGKKTVEMGIGIHAGDLILGTIGEVERMDTTVISDAVNVTSRLQDLTKRFRVPIIVSGPALERCAGARSRFALRYLGQIRLKGKAATVPTYELVCDDVDPLALEKIKNRGVFERAVFLLESGDLVGALAAFKECARRFPKDPALYWYVERFRRARRGVRLEDLLADDGV